MFYKLGITRETASASTFSEIKHLCEPADNRNKEPVKFEPIKEFVHTYQGWYTDLQFKLLKNA